MPAPTPHCRRAHALFRVGRWQSVSHGRAPRGSVPPRSDPTIPSGFPPRPIGGIMGHADIRHFKHQAVRK
jgi:hypothetical protein